MSCIGLLNKIIKNLRSFHVSTVANISQAVVLWMKVRRTIAPSRMFTPSRLPLWPYISLTKAGSHCPCLDQSLAKGDCNCLNGLWPNIIHPQVLGTWLPDQNCCSVSYGEGDIAVGWEPTEFAQRCNTHRHLWEAPHKTIALLAALDSSLICKAQCP